jgi:hypothetical protein
MAVPSSLGGLDPKATFRFESMKGRNHEESRDLVWSDVRLNRQLRRIQRARPPERELTLFSLAVHYNNLPLSLAPSARCCANEPLECAIEGRR